MFQHHLSTLMFRGLDIFALHGENETKRQEWSWIQLDAQKILDTLLISNINPWFKTKFWKFLPFLKFAASVVLYEFNEITINTNSTQITFATGKSSFHSEVIIQCTCIWCVETLVTRITFVLKVSIVLNCVLKMYYNCWPIQYSTPPPPPQKYHFSFCLQFCLFKNGQYLINALLK